MEDKIAQLQAASEELNKKHDAALAELEQLKAQQHETDECADKKVRHVVYSTYLIFRQPMTTAHFLLQ